VSVSLDPVPCKESFSFAFGAFVTLSARGIVC
jgi:hypothetical protein